MLRRSSQVGGGTKSQKTNVWTREKRKGHRRPNSDGIGNNLKRVKGGKGLKGDEAGGRGQKWGGERTSLSKKQLGR